MIYLNRYIEQIQNKGFVMGEICSLFVLATWHLDYRKSTLARLMSLLMGSGTDTWHFDKSGERPAQPHKLIYDKSSEV